MEWYKNMNLHSLTLQTEHICLGDNEHILHHKQYSTVAKGSVSRASCWVILLDFRFGHTPEMNWGWISITFTCNKSSTKVRDNFCGPFCYYRMIERYRYSIITASRQNE